MELNTPPLVQWLIVTVLVQGLGRHRRHLRGTYPDCAPCAKDWPKLDNLLESTRVHGLLHLVCGDDKERSIRTIHRRKPLPRIVRRHSSHCRHATDIRHVLFARAGQGIRYLHFHVLARCTSWANIFWIYRATYQMARPVLVGGRITKHSGNACLHISRRDGLASRWESTTSQAAQIMVAKQGSNLPAGEQGGAAHQYRSIGEWQPVRWSACC